MKTAIYVRVSSQEQVSGYSLDAQTELCKKWASEQGHEVIEVFIEQGQSARTDKRPAFIQAINFVRVGGAEAILVHKLDRFARNLQDYLGYRHLLEKSGSRLLSASEPFLNDDSPESRMVASIIGAVAEYTSDNIGRESRKGRAHMARSGTWHGSIPPIGYKRVDKKLVIDDDKAEVVRQMFRDYATGKHTLESLAKGLLGKNGKPMYTSQCVAILRNTLYMGKYDYKGETFIGDHVPLIDEETFETVQNLLEARNSGGVVKRHFWLLTGLLWSNKYQVVMQGVMAKGKFGYYFAKDYYIRADDIEQKVVKLLDCLTGQTDFCPDYLHMALKVSPNLGLIYRVLLSDNARRDFLNLVFQIKGITVSGNAIIEKVYLKTGFRFIANAV
jgi:DNA invertase Pin-like site-specific DNA recombinase